MTTSATWRDSIRSTPEADEEQHMTAPSREARILVVANRTAATPELMEEVARRREGARFTVIIPPEHADAGHPDWTQDEACELLGRACDGEIATLDGGSDALGTIHDAVGNGDFDLIIVNTPEAHLARLMHHDLTRRLRGLGLPVVVIPPEPGATLPQYLQSGLPGVYRDGLD
jgi:hypothetical protein